MVSSAAPLTWGGGGAREELKFYAAQSGNFALYHNSPAAYFNLTNLLDSIAVGNTVNTRVGNRVFVEELQIRMVPNNKTDRPNVNYRVSVCAAPASSNTDAYGELFYVGGITGTHMPGNSHLLYDATFPKNQGSGMDNNVTPNKERSFTHDLTIPIRKPVVYNTNDQACSTRLIAFITAYDAYGTLTTDNIAVAQTTWRLLYTDA